MGNVQISTIISFAEKSLRAYSALDRVEVEGHYYTTEVDGDLLVVAIAGSETPEHWLLNLACPVLASMSANNDVKKKWLTWDYGIYMVVGEAIVKECKENYPDAKRFVFCGHSKGGTIAVACALCLVVLFTDLDVKVYTFNAPELILDSNFDSTHHNDDVQAALRGALITVEHQGDPICDVARTFKDHLLPQAKYLQRIHYVVESPAVGFEAHSMLAVIAGLKNLLAEIKAVARDIIGCRDADVSTLRRDTALVLDLVETMVQAALAQSTE